MRNYLTKQQRQSRDEYIIANCEKLTVSEAAGYLNIPTSTVRSIISRLKVTMKPAVRFGRGRTRSPEGKVSGPKPTIYEMHEMYNSHPKLGSFMNVFPVK